MAVIIVVYNILMNELYDMSFMLIIFNKHIQIKKW